MNEEIKNAAEETAEAEENKASGQNEAPAENAPPEDTVGEQAPAEQDAPEQSGGEAAEGTDERGENAETEKPEPTETDLLKEENQRLKKQFDELSDRHLRTLAEYENYRKRSQKEKDSAYADAYTDVLKQILPVIDNLERAASYTADAPEDDKLGQGVNMTLKSFEAALKKLGIEEIDAVGCEFDPLFHNAVMHTEDENLGKNVVAAVLQKGYKKGDKVIRYAMVQVAN